MSHVPISTSTAGHAHNWQPIAGQRARYACSLCEAHGYRPIEGGAVREVSTVTHRELAATARPTNGRRAEDDPTPRSRKPTLDETERQRRMR